MNESEPELKCSADEWAFTSVNGRHDDNVGVHMYVVGCTTSQAHQPVRAMLRNVPGTRRPRRPRRPRRRSACAWSLQVSLQYISGMGASCTNNT